MSKSSHTVQLNTTSSSQRHTQTLTNRILNTHTHTTVKLRLLQKGRVFCAYIYNSYQKAERVLGRDWYMFKCANDQLMVGWFGLPSAPLSAPRTQARKTVENTLAENRPTDVGGVNDERWWVMCARRPRPWLRWWVGGGGRVCCYLVVSPSPSPSWPDTTLRDSTVVLVCMQRARGQNGTARHGVSQCVRHEGRPLAGPSKGTREQR